MASRFPFGRRLAPMWLALALCLSVIAPASAQRRPNVLVILTDDQDDHMQSVENMPQLQRYLVSKGTSYPNHFCTIALCCPSRVNMWTGRHGHNTNVTDVNLPYGGYPKVVAEGINDNYLPVWLQDAGYATYYTGKLWNGHTVQNYDAPFVNGFTGSDFIVGPQAYLYYNTSFVRNGNAPKYYEGQYAPDVVARKAHGFLRDALAQQKPWFLVAAPVAPHAEVDPATDPGRGTPPPAAKRHRGLFNDYIIPRTPNFNPDIRGGAAYYRRIDKLNDTVIAYNDNWQRSRLRALQAVDDMIGNLTRTLAAAGELDNTYVIFTTDNGYHISQHRLLPGKRCGLETDIKIPFVVRGPGLQAGGVDARVSAHIDLAPTVMALARAPSRPEFDGGVMPFAGGNSNPEHVNVEHWGLGVIEGKYGSYGSAGNFGRDYHNNTYKSLRLVGSDYSMYYSVWCNGEHEYYDMSEDPDQLHNLFVEPGHAGDYTFAGRPFRQLMNRLDALLLVLKSCKRDACRRPWRTLFPNGQVTSLRQAMPARYDAFFSRQPRIAYERCELGYIPQVEGPMNPNVFGGGSLLLRNRNPFEHEMGWDLMT